MGRALSLYLPWWPTERLRRNRAAHDTGQPLLLVRTVANQRLVAHACAHATRAGVRPGMTLAHARALLPHAVEVREHDAQGDGRSLLGLARWMTRLAPDVMPDETDGLLINVTGCGRLYRGEDKLLKQVLAAATRLKLTARAAIAPTFGAAWAMARYGHNERAIIDHVGRIADALRPLPVRALRVDDETIEALREVGVRQVSQLLDLPARELPSRFSDQLTLRLDQVLGRAIETITPVRFAPQPRVEWTFAGPVTNAQTVWQAVRQLLDALAERLLRIEAGARRLKVTLWRYDAPPVHLPLTVSHPTREAGHLWQLLAPALERANLGHGVEAVEIRCIESPRLPHEQQHHPMIDAGQLKQAAINQQQGRLLDALVHRLGDGRVWRMQPVESHLPERAMRRVPIDHTSPPREAAALPRDRPTQLFDPPQPVAIQALTPDGPVRRVHWRSEVYDVSHCVGPERLTSEWWHEPTNSRDYFKVQVDSGEYLWLYRDARSRQWFIHGWWV